MKIIASLALSLCVLTAFAQSVVVIDPQTGQSVVVDVNRSGGSTIVTDIETGKSTIVFGE